LQFMCFSVFDREKNEIFVVEIVWLTESKDF